MKNKCLKAGVLTILLCCLFALSAEAGIMLHIYPNSIKDRNGQNAASPVVGTNIEFFYPPQSDPTSTTNALTMKETQVIDQGTLLYYKYENMAIDCVSPNPTQVGVRCWKGTIHQKGSYYGKYNYFGKRLMRRYHNNYFLFHSRSQFPHRHNH